MEIIDKNEEKLLCTNQVTIYSLLRIEDAYDTSTDVEGQGRPTKGGPDGSVPVNVSQSSNRRTEASVWSEP